MQATRKRTKTHKKKSTLTFQRPNKIMHFLKQNLKVMCMCNDRNLKDKAKNIKTLVGD